MQGQLIMRFRKLKCAASSSATRLSSSDATPMVRSLVINAKNSNSGTLYIADSAATLRQGIPLTKGQSFSFGSVTTGGHIWGDIDPSKIYIRSTAGTADFVQFIWYGSTEGPDRSDINPAL